MKSFRLSRVTLAVIQCWIVVWLLEETSSFRCDFGRECDFRLGRPRHVSHAEEQSEGPRGYFCTVESDLGNTQAFRRKHSEMSLPPTPLPVSTKINAVLTVAVLKHCLQALWR